MATPEMPFDLGKAALKGTRIMLSGIPYRIIDFDHVSLANQIYLEMVVGDAGLESPGEIMVQDVSLQRNAKLLLMRLYHSGQTFRFLAGIFLPVGESEWTEEIAKVTALRLATNKDPEVKATVQRIIAILLLGFFTAGLSALGISPNASGLTTEPAADAPNEAPSSSGPTAASSGDSEAMTPTG